MTESLQQCQPLADPRRRLVKLSISKDTAAVLLEHVSRGAAHPKVGFEDATRTRWHMERAFMERAVDVEAVESALWSCNLLDELGEFKHPYGITFDEFLHDITPAGYVFHKFFNVFLEERVCLKN